MTYARFVLVSCGKTPVSSRYVTYLTVETYIGQLTVNYAQPIYTICFTSFISYASSRYIRIIYLHRLTSTYVHDDGATVNCHSARICACKLFDAKSFVYILKKKKKDDLLVYIS